MDIFTPVKSPEAPAPKPKVKRTLTIRLEPDQIVEVAQDAQYVGERAKKRKVQGNETKYLGALLRDLAGLAHRTEPDLSLAQFMMAAQPILSPLNQSDAESDGDGNGEKDDVEEEVRDGNDNKSISGIAKRLDMNDGADDALKDSNSVAPALDVERCGGGVLREREAMGSGAARTAPTLDMEIDPRDIIEAGAAKGTEAEGSRDGMDDDMEDYEMNLMREFEESNGGI